MAELKDIWTKIDEVTNIFKNRLYIKGAIRLRRSLAELAEWWVKEFLNMVILPKQVVKRNKYNLEFFVQTCLTISTNKRKSLG